MTTTKYNEHHDERGRFAESDGGSGAGPSSSAEHSYGGATGSPHVSVNARGTIKLKQPYSIKEADTMLTAMTRILDNSLADLKANKPMAGLRYDHARRQMQRALGYAKHFLTADVGKSVETDRTRLIQRMTAIGQKYHLTPIDPSGGDPDLQL